MPKQRKKTSSDGGRKKCIQRKVSKVMREFHSGGSSYVSAAQAAAAGYTMGRKKCPKRKR